MQYIRFMAVWAVVCGVAAVGRGGEPRIQIELQRGCGGVAIRPPSRPTEPVVYVVTSPGGIGSARLTAVAGNFPRDVILRFEYGPERGFSRLEGFDLRTERLRASGYVKETAELQFWFLDPREKVAAGSESSPVPPAGVLRPGCAVRRGALELTLPAHLLQDSRTVQLSWVDAYRN